MRETRSFWRSCLKSAALFCRFRQSVWFSFLLKSLGISVGILSLAMIGKEAEKYDRGGTLRLVTSESSQVESSHLLNPSDLGAQLKLGTEVPIHDSEASSKSVEKTKSPSSVSDSKSHPEECSCPCSRQTGSKKRSSFLKDGRLILNLANEADLQRLPGVGPSRAAAILSLRSRLKGFKKVNDLLRVRGIGWKSLAKLKKKIILDRPKEGS